MTRLSYAKERMDATALPQEDPPVGQRHASSDLCFDKQHLGMQTRRIHLDNVNLCIEILIRDDPAPAERSSLKRGIPRASGSSRRSDGRVYAEVDLLN